MEKRLKLPAGIHTFEKLREDCIYVDKTKYLIDLIDNGSVYFLSRPRRFGKSLTVTTFDSLFSGKKELFKGLYAEEYLNRPEFKPSPVIRLDMSKINTEEGINQIKASIKHLTLRIAKNLEVNINKDLAYSDLFEELIVETARKYSSKIVVLIDEYDNPFTDFIDDPKMAEKVRKVLRNYYKQIKANEEYIRFIFLTGISKFTKMGVFSTLNNIVDISYNPKYGEICGYTEAEIIKYFPEYLEETAKHFEISTEKLVERMRNYYNGFSFDISGKNRLYNPFSTLNFFIQQIFLNFWFESGSTSMISKYMKTQNLTVEQFRNLPVSNNDLKNSVEIEYAKPENFLFQTGYLSLKKVGTNNLCLDYPNTEVLDSMSELVAQNILMDNNDDFTYCRRDLLRGLSSYDYEEIKSVFNRLLASIPYDDFSKAAKDSISDNNYNFTVNEWHYRSMILAFLRGCGVVVIAEMHTNLGRPDLVISHKGKTWIIELKVAYQGENPKKKLDEAMTQIKDKNYTKPFPEAIGIGMVIEDEKRQITEVMSN